MRHTRGPLKWSFIQIYINKTYYTYDASWVRTTLATVIKSILVKILLFSSLEKSFSAVVTASKRFPDLHPDFSGLLVVTHLPSTQIYKFSLFQSIWNFSTAKISPQTALCPRLPNGRGDSLSTIVYTSFTWQLSRVTWTCARPTPYASIKSNRARYSLGSRTVTLSIDVISFATTPDDAAGRTRWIETTSWQRGTGSALKS